MWEEMEVEDRSSSRRSEKIQELDNCDIHLSVINLHELRLRTSREGQLICSIEDSAIRRHPHRFKTFSDLEQISTSSIRSHPFKISDFNTVQFVVISLIPFPVKNLQLLQFRYFNSRQLLAI